MTRFALLPLLFLAAFAANAQNAVKTSPTPDWIMPVEYPQSPRDTVGAGGYFYLLSEWQENLEKQASYYRIATKVLTERGLSTASFIQVNFDPSYQHLYFHTLIIRRGGKDFIILAKAKFEMLRREQNMDRQIYDKSLDATLNLEGVQVGDIIEYSYSVVGYNPVFGNKTSTSVRLNFGIPIGKSVDRIVSRDARKLDFRTFNNAHEPVHETTPEKYNSYTWISDNLTSLDIEDNVPDWHRVYDIVEVSEFHTWGEVNIWALPLYTQTPSDRKAIETKVEEIRSNQSSTEERIQAAIRFVQDEIRYLSFSDGIQGYRPHDPSVVLKQRFGDCKDKSLLLVTMLRQLGVTANPALVHSSTGKRLDKSLPSPFAFDHCIAQFVYNDTTYWTDATASLERGSFKTSQSADYFKALVIAPGTEQLTGIKVPNEPSSTKIYETYSFNVVGGSAELTVKTIYAGARANAIRSYYNSNDKEEVKRSYTNFYANEYPEIRMIDHVEFADNESDNVVTSTEHYEIENFWTRDSVTGVQTAPFYARIISEYFDRPSTKLRKMPFALSHPESVVQTITIEVPEAWNVEASSAEITSPGFKFSSEINYLNRKISHRYAYESRKDHVTASEALRHVKDCDRALGGLSFELTYGSSTSKVTTAGPVTTPFNTPFLLIGIFSLPLFIFGLACLNKYDPRARNYENSYDGFGGWLVLPVIGIFVTPILTLTRFATNEYFNYLQWEILTNPGHGSYNPKLGALVLIEYLFQIAFVVYGVFIIVLMVKRRTSFPLFASIMYGSNVAFICFEYVALNAVGMSTAFDGDETNAAIRALLAAIIWIPYIIYSDRVKGTFRERLQR